MDLEVLLFAVTFTVLNGTFCYDLRCPANKEKNFRRRYVCKNPLEYHCLTNYTSKQYTETCKKSSWMVEGTYAILNNIYINDEVCIPQQFQPFVILSTDANKCIYTKDLCAEKGQVIFNNGTASANSRCRCDYRKGYLFVTKPKEICYCDPVQEDCACALADCKYNKELNSDYVCRNKSKTKREQQMCPEITQGESEILHKTFLTELNLSRDIKPLRSFSNSRRPLPYILFTSLVLLVLGFAISYWQLANEKESESDGARAAQQSGDIVVLGVIREVKQFIYGLQKVTGNHDYIATIRDNSQNTPLDILLNSFQFIFILYTNTFKIENSGLSKEDIVKIKQENVYPSIKIVCNCRNKDKVIQAFDRIDLDYDNNKWEDFVEKNSDFGVILRQLPTLRPPQERRERRSRQSSYL